ncbi:MFS transporter [Vulcanibacillus modesticaldus]|uniref:MFS transporter n=1 Tax=Vulcanibacillus modesticaldus TaxID=337097 RepID=A0A1D2YV53_9BACI|nr:MFS transporter [Vulcanibacillus modesticaldus]OEF99553.1 MFS transporter [Vulcanibacillus modesticaldus]
MSNNNQYKKLIGVAGIGWAFDAMDVGLLSFIMVALANQWGLTPVEKGWLGTINLVGMAIGATLGGTLADKYGRKPVFIYTLLVFGIATAGSALATTFAIMFVFRFIIGLGIGAELPVASTLVSEHAPQNVRGRAVVLLESFWALGWIIAALMAYFVIPSSDYGWRIALLIGGLPAIYAAVIRKQVPESPVYLETKNLKSDRQAIINENFTVRDLFTKYSRETITLWTIWFVIAFSYYGMFLWLPSVLVGKGFTMIRSFEYVLLMTLAQVPGYFTAAYLVEKWGRKPVLITFLTGTAISAWFFGASDVANQLLIWGSLLSFFNLGAWGGLYAYTPENYPTMIRATGSGAAASFGRIGSIIAPFLVGALIANEVAYQNIFLIFTIAIFAGVIVLWFVGKETKNV